VKTVLLVKNDKAGLIALALILRSQGYDVLESSDGDEAIHVCLEQQGPIHLLLMDFDLGGSNAGPKLAERLLELSPEMQVIFMFSSSPNELLQVETLPWGSTFLQKPFSPETLLRDVHERIAELRSTTRRLAGDAEILNGLRMDRARETEQKAPANA
jgi:DNA-binding response OmpR family regulator